MDARDIILESMARTWLYRYTLVRALAVPFGLYLLFVVVDEINEAGVGDFLLCLGMLAAHTMFAVSTHRVVLLGPGSVPELTWPVWSMRELRFAGYILLITLTFVLPLMLGVSIAMLGDTPILFVIVVPIALLWCWVFVRFALVFPGTALEHQITLRRSWEATQPYQFTLLAVLIAYPFIFSILEWAFSHIPLLGYATFILATCTNVLTIAALSVAYRQISEQLLDQSRM